LPSNAAQEATSTRTTAHPSVGLTVTEGSYRGPGRRLRRSPGAETAV
jgi:hypothetical protein